MILLTSRQMFSQFLESQASAHRSSGRQMPQPLMLPHFFLSLSFCCWAQCSGREYPFGQSRSAVLALSPPSSLPSPSLLAGLTEEKSRHWCRASTIQPGLKHWCVINTVLLTNPKHSNTPAAMKKVNSIAARCSTHTRSITILFFFCIWKESRQDSWVSGCTQDQTKVTSYRRSRKNEYVPSTITVSELIIRLFFCNHSR